MHDPIPITQTDRAIVLIGHLSTPFVVSRGICFTGVARLRLEALGIPSVRYAGHQPAGDLYGPHTPGLTSLLTGKLLYIGTRPRRLPIYLVGLVENMGIEPI